MSTGIEASARSARQGAVACGTVPWITAKRAKKLSKKPAAGDSEEGGGGVLEALVFFFQPDHLA